MTPDVMGVVQPIADRIPSPVKAGAAAAVDASISADAQLLLSCVGSAVTGASGSAMTAKFQEGAQYADLVRTIGAELDVLSQRGEKACGAAIKDLVCIAKEALMEAACTVNPLILAGPMAPMALAKLHAVAMKHLGRAEARLRELGAELLQLCTEVAAKEVPKEAIPGSPKEIAAPASKPGAIEKPSTGAPEAKKIPTKLARRLRPTMWPVHQALRPRLPCRRRKPNSAPHMCGAAPPQARALIVPGWSSGPMGKPGWSYPAWQTSKPSDHRFHETKCSQATLPCGMDTWPWSLKAGR